MSFRSALGVALVQILLCFTAVPESAQAQSPEERQRISWTIERGRLLFGIDRAAWVGTDDAFAHIPDPEGAGLRGYIVEPRDDGFDVIFYAGDEENPVVAYRGRAAAGGIVSREIFPEHERPSLTAGQRRLVRAAEQARRTERRPCGGSPFNPLVIPPNEPGAPIDVYLMTPQVDERLPVGGHYRLTVEADGSISSERAFTNTCLLLPPSPSAAVGLFVTHLLDKLPTEIHVFTAMAAGVPMYVGTSEPDRLWEVSGQAIRLVEGPDRKGREN